MLQEADVFLMLLKDSPVFQWGVSPNKLFDYLVSARPVIYSVRSRFNPVEDAQAGLTVPPGDAPSLAKAILSMQGLSPMERWDMGLRGRQYVEQHYNLQKIVGKLEETLADLTLRRQNPQPRPVNA
jgi:glycosyltransferase involved in cell wall biosynthesis